MNKTFTINTEIPLQPALGNLRSRELNGLLMGLVMEIYQDALAYGRSTGDYNINKYRQYRLDWINSRKGSLDFLPAIWQMGYSLLYDHIMNNNEAPIKIEVNNSSLYTLRDSIGGALEQLGEIERPYLSTRGVESGIYNFYVSTIPDDVYNTDLSQKLWSSMCLQAISKHIESSSTYSFSCGTVDMFNEGTLDLSAVMKVSLNNCAREKW